jgi:hypothetical protein
MLTKLEAIEIRSQQDLNKIEVLVRRKQLESRLVKEWSGELCGNLGKMESCLKQSLAA